MSKIVLASGSPRRQELLRRIGITDFDIRVPETDEHYPAGLSPAQTVEYISRERRTPPRNSAPLRRLSSPPTPWCF